MILVQDAEDFSKEFFFINPICYSPATKVEVKISLNKFSYLHGLLDWKISKFYKQKKYEKSISFYYAIC